MKKGQISQTLGVLNDYKRILAGGSPCADSVGLGVRSTPLSQLGRVHWHAGVALAESLA